MPATRLIEMPYAVWGCGSDPSVPRYIREAAASAEAAALAAEHGWDGTRPAAWAVVVLVDAHSLDAHTRYSVRVEGWIAVPWNGKED